MTARLVRSLFSVLASFLGRFPCIPYTAFYERGASKFVGLPSFVHSASSVQVPHVTTLLSIHKQLQLTLPAH
jgi:hypothetical protein